jgi:hypothetical protein
MAPQAAHLLFDKSTLLAITKPHPKDVQMPNRNIDHSFEIPADIE